MQLALPCDVGVASVRAETTATRVRRYPPDSYNKRVGYRILYPRPPPTAQVASAVSSQCGNKAAITLACCPCSRRVMLRRTSTRAASFHALHHVAAESIVDGRDPLLASQVRRSLCSLRGYIH